MLMMAALFFVVLLAFANNLLQQRFTDQSFFAIRDITYTIQDEFLLAAQVQPGYERIFSIPHKYQGFPVTVTIQEKTLEVRYNNQILSAPIPAVQGSISTGKNKIWKDMNGVIHAQPLP